MKNIIAYVLLAILLSSCSTKSSSPNVLLILVDDLGINDIGRNNASIKTPNIDRLASESVYFENHYADATCSPARAALLTGHRATKVGYMPNGRGISPQWLTIPEYLRNNGYSTHHVGKWHLGHYDKDALPSAQGFDSFYGFLSQWLVSKPHKTPITEQDYSAPSYKNPWIEDERGKQTQVKGHLTSILAEEVSRLIKTKRSRVPWFINYWEFAPHTPLQPSPNAASLFPDTPTGKYLALLKDLDDAIGKIDSALKESNQYNNTIVVFLSDNGGTNKQFDNNFPYFGTKTQYLEGGLRTPLMIRWPEKLSPRTEARRASIVDIHATLQALVHEGGWELHQTDGQNLLDSTNSNTDRNYVWATQINGSVSASLLTQQFRLTDQDPSITSDSIQALYDLNLDPSGATNTLDTSSAAKQVSIALRQQLLSDWTINTVIQENDSRLPEIVGDDFQRTPGLNPFTLVLPVVISKLSENDEYSPLLHQESAWSVRINNKNSRLEVDFQNFELSAPFIPSEECQTIIITLDSNAKLNNWKLSASYTKARLYLDGQQEDELSSPSAAYVPDTSQFPTKIGSDSKTQLVGSVMQPLILNVSVPNVWLTPEQLTTQACQAPIAYHFSEP